MNIVHIRVGEGSRAVILGSITQELNNHANDVEYDELAPEFKQFLEDVYEQLK